MEHIVQFAIGIDDNAIVKKIEESAEKQIIKSIEKTIRNKLFEVPYYRADTEDSHLSDYSRRLVESFLEKNKEELLEKAAVYLAEKLARSKAGKALLSGNTESV